MRIPAVIWTPSRRLVVFLTTVLLASSGSLARAQDTQEVGVLLAVVEYAVDESGSRRPFNVVGLPDREPLDEVLQELRARLGLASPSEAALPVCPDAAKILACLTGTRNALLQVSAPEFRGEGDVRVVVTVRQWWPPAGVTQFRWELLLSRTGEQWAVSEVLDASGVSSVGPHRLD